MLAKNEELQYYTRLNFEHLQCKNVKENHEHKEQNWKLLFLICNL